MDRLQTMQVFVRVAQLSGFAAAARDLHMSTAAVSKHVTSLEARIRSRLFDRTTRRVALTEAGRVYLDHCVECLQAFDDADLSVTRLATEPRGALRVSAPFDFDHCLTPVIADLMTAHPHLVVDLKLSNRIVDMVDEGIDVAVRIAPALDGGYIARPIARTRLAYYGSPDYLRKHGRPRRPEDLASHRNLVFVVPRPLDEITFKRGRRTVKVRVNPVLMSNLGDSLRVAAVRGVGLTLMPSFMARADAEAGRLEVVLPDWSIAEFRVFAVYPHRRFLSPNVSIFVDALRAAFGGGDADPWWPSKR